MSVAQHRPDVQRTEEEIVDLVLLSIADEFFSKTQDTSRITRTALMKMVFAIVEDLDLPVTRCWFKFGGYLDHANITEARLNELVGKLAPGYTKFPSAQDVRTKLLPGNKEIYDRCREKARENEKIFFTKRKDMMDEQYRTRLKGELRDVYLANREYTEFVWGMMNRIKDQGTYPMNACQKMTDIVTRFHKQLSKMEDGERIVLLFSDFLDIVEQLFITLEARHYEEGPKLDGWVSTMKMVQDYYNDSIWAYPAYLFAIKTAKGPRKDDIVKQKRTAFERIDMQLEDLAAFKARVQSTGNLPTLQELEAHLERTKAGMSKERVKVLEKILGDHKGGYGDDA
jgi:hypothetical protein